MSFTVRSTYAILCTAVLFSSCGKTNSGSSSSAGPNSNGTTTINSISPLHGPGGAKDTLTGSGFNALTNGNTITLNGKQATVVSETDNQLVVTIPSLAGSGSLIIQTAKGNIYSPNFKYDTVITITTLAGSGSEGMVNGTGNAASFDNPSNIAIDKAGNLFVSDYLNACIRKITPAGVVTTFAGGVRGYLDAVGTAAQMGYPRGLAFDQLGNLLVCDPDNQRIRSITPDGTVTTIAGSGGYYETNGPALSATFSDPYAVTVDAAGNIYIADLYNNAIRKITGGIVSSFAGGGYYSTGDANGPVASALFYEPGNVVVSPYSGNLYVTDGGGNTVRKINTSGVVSTLAGQAAEGSQNGLGASAQFSGPGGIAIDKFENLYIADIGNATIRRIDSIGNVTTFAGWGVGDVDGAYPTGSFRWPCDLAIDATGNLYVADQLNNKIRKVTIQ